MKNGIFVMGFVALLVASVLVGTELQQLRLENANLHEHVQQLEAESAMRWKAEVQEDTPTYEQGLAEGAKIGLAEEGYRLDEVKACCETLFTATECTECHPNGGN